MPGTHTNVYFSQLPPWFCEQDLLAILPNNLAVKSSRVKLSSPGVCAGYGFVMFESAEQAKIAISALNGIRIPVHRPPEGESLRDSLRSPMITGGGPTSRAIALATIQKEEQEGQKFRAIEVRLADSKATEKVVVPGAGMPGLPGAPILPQPYVPATAVAQPGPIIAQQPVMYAPVVPQPQPGYVVPPAGAPPGAAPAMPMLVPANPMMSTSATTPPGSIVSQGQTLTPGGSIVSPQQVVYYAANGSVSSANGSGHAMQPVFPGSATSQGSASGSRQASYNQQPAVPGHVMQLDTNFNLAWAN